MRAETKILNPYIWLVCCLILNSFAGPVNVFANFERIFFQAALVSWFFKEC